MTREARDATFDTSDGSAIAFTLHGAPRTGAPRLALIHSLATPKAMARQLHEAIPHSTLTVLPGARHLTPIECRDQISSQLLTVLQRS